MIKSACEFFLVLVASFALSGACIIQKAHAGQKGQNVAKACP